MDEIENCPTCNQGFPIEFLISHAPTCKGLTFDNHLNSKPSHHNDRMDLDEEDEDFKLALQLQQEEEAREQPKKKPKDTSNSISDEDLARQLYEQERSAAKKESSTIKCQLCSSPTDTNDLYILDECTHRFCQTCIKNYVSEKIQTSVNLECPLKECKVPLSVRDMNDLLPKIKQSHIGPKGSSHKATERIMSELKHITKSNPEKNGYSVQPLDDNLYKWELSFFDFDKTEPLAQDMAKMKIKKVVLHVVFPPNYPFSPPYIRVIKPRFQYRTGHVTIGGSICMEILTNKGWSPANTLEAIIVSIRAQLIAGGARLDPHNKTDYTEGEARDAFDRMVRDHGWF